MTEQKKKRGRPKKINPDVAEYGSAVDFKEVCVLKADGSMTISSDAALVASHKEGVKKSINRAIKEFADSEKLIPPAGLSKIAALQWLTEHRK